MPLVRRRLLGTLVALSTGLGLFAGCGSRPTSQTATSRPLGAGELRLTWLSVTNWVLETTETRILFDSFYTRPPQPIFDPSYRGGGRANYSVGPKPSDPAAVNRVLAAIDGKTKKIEHILVGHSHFDHAMDTPTTAQLTGAKVIGSPTTCLQAQGEGIPAAQCTPVKGGERITLHRGVTLYVIHSNHSGNGADGQHRPLELTTPPKVSPPTTAGGMRPGVLEDMPNGGGSFAYLIKVDRPQGKSLSVLVQDSGSTTDFTKPIVVDHCVGPDTARCDKLTRGETYPPPASGFRAALKAAGLGSVDVLIGTQQADLAAQQITIMHPKFFLPSHWDSDRQPITAGMSGPFTPPRDLAYLLDSQDVRLLTPRQYADAWVVGTNGVTPVMNQEVKRRLGIADVQKF